jgi:hypothetical protein
MSAIWMQSFNGNRIDLLEPSADQVDFREIAETLARINRFAGATEFPISVAYHTIIATHACPQELVPWVLLHDAHEAWIGDIITPVAQALARVCPDGFESGLRILKHRADVAVHTAAGLPLPTPDQRALIRRADLVALTTERRDFLRPCVHKWHKEIESMPPLPRVFRPRALQACAIDLYELFTLYLPALQSQRAPARKEARA